MGSNQLPISDIDHAAYQAVTIQAVYEENGFGPESFFVPTIFAQANGVEFARAVAERMFELRRSPEEMETIRDKMKEITVGEWIQSHKD